MSIAFFAFLFGAAIGSFLNVCIYRLPLHESIVFPGSHCRACSTPLTWYDNLPLLSYLARRGRCRSCGAEFELADLILLCPCGSADVDVLTGRDLRILSMEVS